MIIAPSERAGDIYCRKRLGPGRFGSSTYSCGIKVGRLADRHGGAGDGGEKKRAEGTVERIPIIHDAGWRARNPAIPVCLNSQGKRMIVDFIVCFLVTREFVRKIHFRHGRTGKLIDCDAIVRLNVSFSFLSNYDVLNQYF